MANEKVPKNFIDFIHEVGNNGELLAEYVATKPTVQDLGKFFDAKGYDIKGKDLEHLAEAKKDSIVRLAFTQEAFTPLIGKSY